LERSELKEESDILPSHPQPWYQLKILFFNAYCISNLVRHIIFIWVYEHVMCHLPSLHCTVIGFALDWESHESLKHDRECLTELLERFLFQPYPIQRIQLAEVGWESDNKDSSGKEVGWFVLSLGQPFLYLFDTETTAVAQISLFKLICSKNDGLIYLIVLPVRKLHLVRVEQTGRLLRRLQDISNWPEGLLPQY